MKPIVCFSAFILAGIIFITSCKKSPQISDVILTEYKFQASFPVSFRYSTGIAADKDTIQTTEALGTGTSQQLGNCKIFIQQGLPRVGNRLNWLKISTPDGDILSDDFPLDLKSFLTNNPTSFNNSCTAKYGTGKYAGNALKSGILEIHYDYNVASAAGVMTINGTIFL